MLEGHMGNGGAELLRKLVPSWEGSEPGGLGMGADCRQPNPALRGTPPKTSIEKAIQAAIKLIGKTQLVRGTNQKVPF